MLLNLRSSLTQANDLMENGKWQEAGALIEQTLSSSTDAGDYSDAVSIYLMGHRYSEALAVFDRYEQQTGRDLDNGSDFKRADVEEQQQAFDFAQKAAGGGSAAGESTAVAWPTSPAYIVFMLMFAGIGGMFLYWVTAGKLNGVMAPVGLVLGAWLVATGVLGMLTYLKAGPDGLEVLAPNVPPRKRRSGGVLLPIPQHHVIPYGDIRQANVVTVSAGRGVGVGLELKLADGSNMTVNLGPFTRAACRSLVTILRSRGAVVFVMPGILGKHFA